MHRRRVLFGREKERAVLDRAIEAARTGRGGLVLVAGETGVGKTALVSAALAECSLLTLVGAPSLPRSEAYGPIAAVFRVFRRMNPDGLHGSDPLAAYLNLLLPEMGCPPKRSEPAVLVEAVRWGFERIAAQQPAIVFLDDLHWADEATIDLLCLAADWLRDAPLLVIGAYQSDALPRDHALRRLRLELRQAGLLQELKIEPLTETETAGFAAHVLGKAPSLDLQAILHERTQGLPFFIEEVAAALAATGRLRTTATGLALDPSDPLPIPDSIRDAALLRTSALSDVGRTALQVAAVTGVRFGLDLVEHLAGESSGLDELLERQILVEVEPGVGAFRHALVREAVYTATPWGRRRALHRTAAEHLEAQRAPPGLVAEHWIAAQASDRARHALIAAVEAFCAVHAYRDAARAARQALDLWTHEAGASRLELLERLGHCAEVSGAMSEAALAWRAAADGWREIGDLLRLATAERRLASVCELQGAWQPALAAHLAAADAYAANGAPGEAAAERLAVAGHLRLAASYNAALPLLEVAQREAEEAGRVDLTARALGHEGNARARLGQYDTGLALMRDGLSLALTHNLVGPAAEVYQRLADGLEHAGQYGQARETYLAAADFCRVRDEQATSQLCLACMTVVLRQIGEWDRAVEVSRSVLASESSSEHSRTVATGMLGSVYALRGDARRARPLLLQSATLAHLLELTAMELLNEGSFAVVEELSGNVAAAAGHCLTLLDRWERTEERHYTISPLRWAVTFFAVQGAAAEVRACASALSRIAADAAIPESLAGLAHALGETLLMEGDAEHAIRQFEHALIALRETPLPFDVAQTQLRLGIAVARTGQHAQAIVHLTDAYRLARKLGARPLAAHAMRELTSLGAPAERRPGRRLAADAERGGLSQREFEVLQHVALGRTDREIARVLILSPRTVETHVANCLTKLGCRTRAEAIRRASELGVLST
jgi:DNA-binding CsgD family transcriptional regulator